MTKTAVAVATAMRYWPGARSTATLFAAVCELTGIHVVPSPPRVCRVTLPPPNVALTVKAYVPPRSVNAAVVAEMFKNVSASVEVAIGYIAPVITRRLCRVAAMR
jgi:hypothetical protein